MNYRYLTETQGHYVRVTCFKNMWGERTSVIKENKTMRPDQMVCPIKKWDELEQVEVEKIMHAAYTVSAEAPNKIHFFNKDTQQKLLTIVVPLWYYRVCKEFERK